MRILFGLDLLPAALLTAVVSFALLAIQRYGHVGYERVIMAFVAVIGAAFVVELFIAKPDPAGILSGMLVPHLPASAVYVAVGMVGATVMPHVVYLHSGLVQHRNRILQGESRSAHFKRELIDIVLAMNGAFLINSAMVIMAAAVFYANGVPVNGIEEADRLLKPLLGQVAPAAFGIALLASGLSSSAVGTMADR
jgi:manganese transport protein